MSFVAPQAQDVRQVLSAVMNECSPAASPHVEDAVAAVITVEHDLTYLPDTLRALLRQSLLPRILVIADCSGATVEPLYAQFPVDGSARVEVQVVRARGASSFGDAVGKALGYARLPGRIRALWLLHDDCRPMDKHCLDKLVDTWHSNPTASLLGAKQYDWQGEGLRDVGRYAYHHRTVSLVVDSEPDQEQYDARQDVFAVSLAGALVSMQTMKDLGGPGAWASTFGQADDLCRRICLSGGRVVVVPSVRMAHASARMNGLRDRNGRPVQPDRPLDASMGPILARERYLLTDFALPWWLLVWLWRVLAALWFMAVDLIGKRPYRALCRLCAPWRILARPAALLTMRRRLTSACHGGPRRLDVLQANGQQIRQWRQRRQAFHDQQEHPMLSHLALAHLRQQFLRRLAWASGMTIAVLVALVATHWPLCRSIFSGGAIHAPFLPSSGAAWSQLLAAATTSWSWAGGIGQPAVPAPFLLVLLPFALLTGGHVAQAMALMLLTEMGLAALSFWALAGVVTRSNPIRVLLGLLWACLAFALGIVDGLQLPMLTVMAFMPAAFAFVFKAVGLYQTEAPVHPKASVQQAALASVCFLPVLAAEPQLMLAIIPLFIMAICLVPAHRIMLLLMPLPSVLSLMPTLVNSLHHANQGLWKQIFADLMVPSADLTGKPRTGSLGELLARLLGMDVSALWPVRWRPELWRPATLACCLLAVALLAFVALVVPRVLRAARILWITVLLGLILALVSQAVCTGLDQTGPVAGSVLPGMMMAFMGLLTCLGLLAGRAVRPFSPLAPGHDDGEADRPPLPPAQSSSTSTAAVDGDGRVLRLLLGLVLALVTVGVAVVGLAAPVGGPLSADGRQLPAVAVDYLDKDPSHRVLVLTSPSHGRVAYTGLHTTRGELIDASPALRAQRVNGRKMAGEDVLSHAAAALMANADSKAVAAVTDLGFGGIYVPVDRSGAAGLGSTPNDDLVSNITASDGAQQVVANVQGAYFRLSSQSGKDVGVDMTGVSQAEASTWRRVWLWTLGLVLLGYCLVALPRPGYFGGEQL
ncbi:glycosyltransferase family 2 protein [Bifidobacterium asteroides]|uniref:glycosyltransferase family 2 protein n=1 Tax=Bifidobacterium asteroides TaxID=1684 RepID=UPI0020C5121E|nr:glycosyltransferase family 2 protein [Bifidobacterium asteroides]MCP8614287.1 glycosyltransferase family 2 protein [Bifidobacterium asteroides]